jgi:hypothetical protein
MRPGRDLPLAPSALALTGDTDGGSCGFWEGERRRIPLLTRNAGGVLVQGRACLSWPPGRLWLRHRWLGAHPTPLQLLGFGSAYNAGSIPAAPSGQVCQSFGIGTPPKGGDAMFRRVLCSTRQ